MRKFLVFDNGTEVELSPLSYREFMALDMWSGSSDMAYEEWVAHNNYATADEYSAETLASSAFRVTLEPVDLRQFEFDPNGSGNWSPHFELLTKGLCRELVKSEVEDSTSFPATSSCTGEWPNPSIQVRQVDTDTFEISHDKGKNVRTVKLTNGQYEDANITITRSEPQLGSGRAVSVPGDSFPRSKQHSMSSSSRFPVQLEVDPEYRDLPVEDGTVVIVDAGAIESKTVPWQLREWASSFTEIHLGIKATHKHVYGRIDAASDSVLIPGLGTYPKSFFRVIRLLRDSDG